MESRSNVLIRGIGPTLANIGVENPVSHPQLTLLDQSGQVIATNLDWRLAIPAWSGEIEDFPTTQTYDAADAPIEALSTVQSSIGAFAPTASDKAVIYVELPPGLYTAHLSSADAAVGVGLLEIYQVDETIDPFPPEWRVRQSPDQNYTPTRQGLAPIATVDEKSGSTLHLMFSADQIRPFIPGQSSGTSTFSNVSIPWFSTGTQDLRHGLAGVTDSRGWTVAPRYSKTSADTATASVIVTLPGEESAVREEVALQFSSLGSGTFTYQWGYDDPSIDSIALTLGQADGTFVWTNSPENFSALSVPSVYRIFPKQYEDGRPSVYWAFRTQDIGPVLLHGDGVNNSDINGAREAIVTRVGNEFIMHYDGCDLDGWRACRAVSSDLVTWTKEGPILELGVPGEVDAGCACSPWMIEDGGIWHMFYLATATTTPPPELIPSGTYLTRVARASSAYGPWIKQNGYAPFDPQPNTYYSIGTPPGFVLQYNGEWLQFFTAGGLGTRTIGLARTNNLGGAWTIDSNPLLSIDQQIENSSLYFEPANGLWFLFTNHVGLAHRGFEYTDAVWVYWSDDPTNFDSKNRAVVVDATTSSWSKAVIGMPSVVPFAGRLALLYDGNSDRNHGHMRRDIGLTFLDLPLQPPVIPSN